MTRFGLMPHRLFLGALYSLGALIAILCAAALGLDHPQWAGMTVWAIAQPVRGAMLEKLVYRFGGTALGVMAGVAIIAASSEKILPLALLITLWVALCTWRGNGARSHRSYFWLLSGYSASMVALIDFGSSDPVLMLALDRFLTVCLGLVIGGVIASIFVPRAPAHPEDLRAEQKILAQREADPLKALPRFAAMEAALELAGAGSPRRHREAAQTRGDLLALSWQTRQAGAQKPQEPCPKFGAPDINSAGTHKDHISARHAGLRVIALLTPLSLFWAITQLQSGPYLLLGASVMISIFSNFEAPQRMMPWVFFGQVLAVIFALATRWLLWPFAPNDLVQILMLIPALSAAAVTFAHPRLLKMALDLAMCSLLLLPVGATLSGSFGADLGKALATASAPLLALLAFLLFFRTGADVRKRNARKVILAELALYASGRRALPQDDSWHLRHEQRALRLAQGGLSAADLALLQLGDEIYAFLKAQALPERRFKLVAARLGRLHNAPAKALAALQKWGGRDDLVALARQAQIL